MDPNLSPEDVIAILGATGFPAGEVRPPGEIPFGRIKGLLEALPRLEEADLVKAGEQDGVCSVCYVPFLAVLAEEEYASVMESPAHPPEELGVTRLSEEWQCGHIFCRKDITKWIREGKDSCPLCRKPLLDRSQPEGDSQQNRTEDTFNRPMASERVAIDDFFAHVLRRAGEENEPRGRNIEPTSEPRYDEDTQYNAMYS